MDSDQFSDSDDDDFVGKSAAASNPPPAEEDDPPPAEEDDGDDAFVKHMESVTAADRPATLLLKHVGCKWHLQAQASPIRWRAPSPVCTERLAGVV